MLVPVILIVVAADLERWTALLHPLGCLAAVGVYKALDIVDASPLSDHARLGNHRWSQRGDREYPFYRQSRAADGYPIGSS